MRGTIPGLPTPHPLLGQLPAVYLEHDFLARFLAALDEVLAPALLTLDSLGAYLDPATAPADFLRWLASWVGVDVGVEPCAEDDRRAIATAIERHRRRGTARGLADLVWAETGVEPEITETGGTSWTTDPGMRPDVAARGWVTVRVRLAGSARIDRRRLERLVAAEMPAHVGYDLQLLPPDGQP